MNVSSRHDPYNTSLDIIGSVLCCIGTGVEEVTCAASALTVGSVSSHVFGKTLEGFTTVEIIPHVVHALQEYAPPSLLGQTSTYYLTGIATPYVLNAVGLVGGTAGVTIGYYMMKKIIESVKYVAKAVFSQGA